MHGPEICRGAQRPRLTGSRCRGQSETIGVVLLTAVVVLTIAVTGSFLLSQVAVPTEPQPNLVVEVNASALAVEHDGGDSLPLEDLTVILAGDVEDQRGLAAFSEEQGNDNDRFEAGERRADAHTATDSLTVRVVHEPSNTLLVGEEFDIP